MEESLAIVEVAAVSSALLALDRTLKETDVKLIELRLGAGLSGKGVFTLTGPLHMIEAARDVTKDAVRGERLIRIEVIAQPHADLPRHLLGAESASVRGPAS
jgi:microcompartment protein CcmL/EutN